jgi:hypothetical protein
MLRLLGRALAGFLPIVSAVQVRQMNLAVGREVIP